MTYLQRGVEGESSTQLSEHGEEASSALFKLLNNRLSLDSECVCLADTDELLIGRHDVVQQRLLLLFACRDGLEVLVALLKGRVHHSSLIFDRGELP